MLRSYSGIATVSQHPSLLGRGYIQSRQTRNLTMNNITTIDFTSPDYSDAMPFISEDNDGNILHFSELERAFTLIENALKKAECSTDTINGEIRRLHNTISVIGTRGSGKTSFLMSLKAKVTMNHELNDKILFLDIIDPTLIEAKEHVFVNIVSRIVTLVRKHYKYSAYDYPKKYYQPNSEYTQWENNLSELSKCLPSIEGIGKKGLYDEWEDADYILEKGLERATSANDLERNFSKLVQKSLEILGKKCLIIPFDDVDTDFTKGWEILECIRKYLTSPVVLPIISGDISLYSFLVRKQQWTNLNNRIMDIEDKKSYYIEMVDHLESQYMLKVLKPENRIMLPTLYEKVIKQNQKIRIKLGVNNVMDIFPLYCVMAEEIGIYHNQHYIAMKLLSLPIRTQIRLLQGYADSKRENNEFSSKLLNIFWSDIANHYNHPDDFKNEGLNSTIPMLAILYQNRQIQDTMQFMPVAEDSMLNNALLAISANFHSIANSNCYLPFDYWARIGSLTGIVNNIEWDGFPSISDLVEHAKLLADRGIRKHVSLITSYLYSIDIYNKVHSSRDIISLYSFQNDNNSFEEEFKNSSFTEHCIAYLPLIGIRNGNSLTPVYSFSVLLSSIGELIYQVRDNKYDTHNKNSNIKDITLFKLQRLSQFKEFNIISFIGSYADSGNIIFDEDDTNRQTSESELIQTMRQIATAFMNWVEKYDGHVSAHILGRIATRFYTSVQRIQKSGSLGQLFHRHIVLFMNSILVEDAIEHGVAIPFLDNPINSNYIFTTNLKESSSPSKQKYLKFSMWMLKCPILHCYIDPQLSDTITAELQVNSSDKLSININAKLGNINARTSDNGKKEVLKK